MALTDNLTCLYQPPKTCNEIRTSIDGALIEQKTIYQERLPYTINEVVGGLCLTWNEMFLALCRYAMSTDCLDSMTSQEREIWRYFVEFEDAHSHSAMTDQCEGKADGVTDPREIEIDSIIYPIKSYPLYLQDQKEGFMVMWNEDNGEFELGTTIDVPSMPKYCIDEVAAEPLNDVPKAYVYDDLDSQFVNIHDCKPYNTCGCEDTVILETNDCHNPGDAPSDPDAIYDDLYKTGCTESYCSVTVNK